LLRPAPGGMFTTNRQDRGHTRPRSDSLTYRYSSATNARAAPTAIPRASRAISPATRWRFTYSPLSYAGPGSGCNDNPARCFPLPRSARFSYAASSLETATPTTSRPDAQHPAGVLSVAEPWSGVRDWYAGHKGGVHGTVAAGIKTVDRRRVELSLRGESGTTTGQLLSVGEGGIELSPRKSKTNPTAKAPWAKRRPPFYPHESMVAAVLVS
jgi:hypothetical protein